VSADGEEYKEAVTNFLPEEGSLFFINLPEDQQDEYKLIRFDFLLAPGTAHVSRLLACGTLDGLPQEKEDLVPVLISDGRSLVALHVSSVRLSEEREQKLHVHVLDHITGRVKTSFEFLKEINQSQLHQQGLATNGENLILFRLTNGDFKKPRYTGFLLDFNSQEVVEEREFEWDQQVAPRLVPQAFVYDMWNNFIWGYDCFHGKLTRWGNMGNPPRFHSPRPRLDDLAFSPVALYRLEALGEAGPWAKKQQTTGVQAAKILCHLDRCAEIFSVPEKAPADNSRNELLVSSCGRDDGNVVRFVVRGQNAWDSPSRGFNLVVLDSQYNAVSCRSFDTASSESFHNEMLVDFISRIPDGSLVMVATKEEASSCLNNASRRALKTLGADQGIDKLEGTDIFVLIGRKGANSANAVQKIVKHGGGSAIIRQKVPFTHVPLSLEPTRQTFESLIEFIRSNREALWSDKVPAIMQVHVLSALSIMTTNIYQLLSVCPSVSKETLPADMAQLKDMLLKCIDKPPEKSAGGRSIAEAALKLFVSSIDYFYPTATQRCNLLIEYMNQYVAGKLSSLEASVLGLLLKRISSPSSLRGLLDEQRKTGSDASLDLFVSILGIAKGEIQQAIEIGPKKIEENKYAIGHAAVQMLSSLCSQLLSQTAHSIVLSASQAGEDKGTLEEGIKVLRHIFSSICECSMDMLDKAISMQETAWPRSGPRTTGGIQTLTKEMDTVLRTSPVGALLPLVVLVTMELVRYQSSSLLSALSDLAKMVAPLMDRVKRAVDLLPKDKRGAGIRGPIQSTPRKKVITMESDHPYRPNMNDFLVLNIPRADRITIEFDVQTATETNYDYLIFWRDNNRSERWHEAERLTGRSGSENWPGQQGRPPLIIEGDSAVIEWHTDGSNEDW